MPTPLKYIYNPAYFERLCPMLRKAVPGFDCRYFVLRVFNNTWPDLELNQRASHIAVVLRDFLSSDTLVASNQVAEISRLLRSESRNEEHFGNTLLAEHIEIFALDHLDKHLMAMGKTKETLPW